MDRTYITNEDISSLDNLELILAMLIDELEDLKDFLQKHDLVDSEIFKNRFYNLTVNDKSINVVIKKAPVAGTTEA